MKPTSLGRNETSDEISCTRNFFFDPINLCKFLFLNCSLDLTFSVIDGSELDSVQFTAFAFGTKIRNFFHIENIVTLP